MLSSVLFAWVVGVAPPAAAEPSDVPVAEQPVEAASESVDMAEAPVAPREDEPALGRLVFGPGLEGEHTVVDTAGRKVATVHLQDADEVSVSVPYGEYSVQHQGKKVVSMVVSAEVTSARYATRAREPEIIEEEPESEVLEEAPRRSRERKHKNWRVWGAPLFSAFVPGLGQIVNREPGKGVAVLVGMAAMGIGTWTLEGSKGWGATSFGAEAVRLGGIATLTGGMQMVYAWQILQAYRTAAGKGKPEPHVGHKVDVHVTRYASIGRGAGNNPTYLTDWNVNIMGQVAKRFTIGFSDLSVKVGRGYTSGQAGLRLSYRMVDRRRLWLAGSLGGAFQFTSRVEPDRSLSGDPQIYANQSHFAAIPYGQLELRWFVLDRWSLNLMPRVSAPLAGPRVYSQNRQTAQNAVTFELGTGVGVYF